MASVACVTISYSYCKPRQETVSENSLIVNLSALKYSQSETLEQVIVTIIFRTTVERKQSLKMFFYVQKNQRSHTLQFSCIYYGNSRLFFFQFVCQIYCLYSHQRLIAGTGDLSFGCCDLYCGRGTRAFSIVVLWSKCRQRHSKT